MTERQDDSRGRIIICGGSMAGLFAGLLLRRQGWRVDIFERSGEELASRGAGLVTHRELYEALSRCGIHLDRSLGVEVPGRITLQQDGSLLGTRPLVQIMTSWDRLYRLLREALPRECYHSGELVCGFEQSDTGVTVFLSGGDSERADLLIGADGFRSGLRAQLLPEVAPAYAGYVAWRGLVEEEALSQVCSQDFVTWFGFCLPEHEQMLGYLVAGVGDDLRPGHRRYNWVWYRPAEATSALADLLTDAEGRVHEMAIPPDQVRGEILSRLRADARRVLSSQFNEVVRLTERPFFQPIYDLECPRLVFGRVLLMGDAAFVGRPHVGMGVTKAAADALALADAMEAAGHDHRAALPTWEADRLSYGRAVVKRGRELGAELEAGAAAESPPEVSAQARAADLMSTIGVGLARVA